MNQYEVTFIVDPVLSGDEIKSTAQTYVDTITSNSGEIVHVDEMGLRQLAYPLKKRTTGIYYCIEFKIPNGELISKMELAFRRDERIMRFLTVRLDKFGVKYNDDKRNGLIGKKRSDKKSSEGAQKNNDGAKAVAKAATKKKTATAPVAAPVTTAASSEEE